ncbi:MAG: 16S rRNA (cytosine(967)-C(5))-methyltransferase RsmB [Lachnospiraceae bacterium]|nr:16S rRNA (cytosine(967)-C(5))-methyltransferase RsmB [Lachnospiraceae bacterium]
MAENTREIVLDSLLVLEKEDILSHKLMKDVLDKYDYLDGREKAFIKRVTEGTIERRIELDYYLNSFSSVPVHKMKPFIRNLLRMSVYQILFLDGVPDSAVCNEACKLAGKRKFHNLKGFVNGILRNIAKHKKELPLPDEQQDFTGYLSVKYSMPEWLVELWLGEYDRELVERMLEGLLQIHPVSLRFPTTWNEEQRESLAEKLRKAGAEVRQSEQLPYIYWLENAEGLQRLPGYAEGNFVVQDISSALAVEAAGIQAGDFVMDICAAPGGKAMLAAERAKYVLARDVSEKKTAIITENLERMGLSNIEVQVFDATQTDAEYIEKADVLLMDVPCSGLGVMGKKRDIKYRVSPESLKSIVALQQEIVEHSWQYVKPGGVLLYSTCTVNPAENERMAEWIVEHFPFEEEMHRQIFPGEMEADGFFFARLRRKE